MHKYKLFCKDKNKVDIMTTLFDFSLYVQFFRIYSQTCPSASKSKYPGIFSLHFKLIVLKIGYICLLIYQPKGDKARFFTLWVWAKYYFDVLCEVISQPKEEKISISCTLI